MKFVVVAVACLSVALAAELSGHEPIPVLNQVYNIDDNGNFKYQYETGNGIAAEAEGVLKNAGTEGEAFVIKGRHYHTSPEGQEVVLSYTADELGYHPEGPLLPQPHAIPELIARSIEWTRTHTVQQKK